MGGYGERGYGLGEKFGVTHGSGYGITGEVFLDNPTENFLLQDSDLEQFQKSLDETTTLQETFEQEKQLFRPVNEEVKIKDVTSRKRELPRTQTQTLATKSRVQRTANYTRQRTEQTGLAAQIPARQIGKDLDENINLQDLFNRELDLFRDFTAILNILDSDIKTIEKPLKEALNLQDKEAQILHGKKNAETLTVTDTFAEKRVFKDLDQILNINDNKALQLERSLEASVNFSNFIQLRRDLNIAFAQGINLQDNTTKKLEKDLNEQIQVLDIFDRVFEGFRDITVQLYLEIGYNGFPLLSGDPITNLLNAFPDEPNDAVPMTREHNKVEKQ